jgi:cytoskeletal protein RodZ
MQTIGNYLKSGREARNIRLSEVARSTKISKWYLDCLEKDEFDKIPGGPYIKGYIASYASYIGIEEDEILKRYDSLQIDRDEENVIQDQLPQDKKSQKLNVLSFSKKNLFVLSMAVLIFLAVGLIYFLLQNKTHIVAQLQDPQDSKMQSPPLTEKKQVKSGLGPNRNSVQPVKSENIAKNKEDNFNKKQETASTSGVADASKNIHLKTGDEPDTTHQEATETESLALLPLEKEGKGTGQAILIGKNDTHSQNTTEKEPVIRDTSPPPGDNNVTRPARTDSKTLLNQNTPLPADLNSGSASAPGYRIPDAQPQAANNVRVIRAVATSEIKSKNPANPSNSFQWTTEKVYIWSMIECQLPPATIRHTYYFNGQKVNDVELKIKSPQWRTWSYKTLLNKRYIGHWKVDIFSDGGKLLQSVYFEVY